MAEPGDFCVFSALVTGSDRGISLGLVKRFLELPSPPKWVFATTLDLEGEETKTALNMLTMCQSLGYSADGIMTVAIHPGLVNATSNPILETSVEESTQGILTVLSNLCDKDNGTFLDYLGQRLPW